LSNKNDRLYIIGEGNLQEEYEKRIRQLGLVEKVFIEKFSSEPYSLIKGSALVVFPSNYEGFGNVLLESIFCETPIIATDFKGIDRQIRDLLFDNGLLVELGNIDDMASKINYVRDNYDVAKNATINIKKIISDRFSLEKNIALLEAEFDKI
jgi:glycosyltransferase involved in cell wall biosynthesis